MLTYSILGTSSYNLQSDNIDCSLDDSIPPHGMSPSKESQALGEHFEKLISNFPQDGNHILERALYEQVREVATEAPGVTIEDVIIPGDGVNVPCKWFKPEGSSSAKHTILFMHGGGFR